MTATTELDVKAVFRALSDEETEETRGDNPGGGSIVLPSSDRENPDHPDHPSLNKPKKASEKEANDEDDIDAPGEDEDKDEEDEDDFEDFSTDKDD